MRLRKRLIALGLAAILVAGTTGCMQKEKGTESTGGGNSDATEAVAVQEDANGKYEKEVVLTTVEELNSGTEFQNGDTYDDNTWYRAYKDRFNVQVKNLWVSNDYNTKLNLTIAEGNIPDVFRVSAQQLTQLQESGLIMDLTEIFDKYASDTLKGYMDVAKDTYETGFFDGKLYGIPQLSYGIIDQFQYVWIRKDWKDQMGLADPQSMDDVIAIGKAFAKSYGGYPMAEQQSLDNMNRLALGWGAHPGIWVKKEDGTLEYGSIQPVMKEVLKTYAQWYKDGVLNPDFPVLDQEKMFQDLVNGKTGVIPFAQWLGYYPGPDIIKNQGPEALFEPYPIPSVNGAEVKGNVSMSNRGYIVIGKNCENPEAAMKLINFFCYMMDEAAGKETPEFISSLYDNNYPNIPFGLCVINPMTDYNQFIKVTDALKKGLDVDVTELGKDASKYNSCVKWLTKQDPNGVGDFLQQGNEKSAYGIAKNYVDNEIYVKNALWGMDTPTLLNAGTTLNDILKEGYTRIIIGEEDIDYFDTVVEQWKKAGGEQATKEVNETYGNK